MTFNYIETFIAFVDGLLLSGVAAISAALSGWMQTLMPAVLGIYVAVIGFQMIGGSLGRTPREVVSIAVRVAIVLALVRYSDLYQEYVAVPMLQTVPDEIGRVLGSALGGVVRGNAFDKIVAGCLALVINVGKSLGWGQIFIAFALVPCAFVLLAAIAVCLCVWSIGHIAITFLVPFGPVIIAFMLFEATRGYLARWIDQLVALILLQLMSITVLVLVMRVTNDMLQRLGPNGGNSDAYAQLVSIAFLAILFGVLAYVMSHLPQFAQGLGAGTHLQVGQLARSIQGQMYRMARGAGRTAASATGADAGARNAMSHARSALAGKPAPGSSLSDAPPRTTAAASSPAAPLSSRNTIRAAPGPAE